MHINALSIIHIHQRHQKILQLSYKVKTGRYIALGSYYVQILLFALIFTEPPQRVRNLVAQNISARRISISWLPPLHDGFSAISNYTVQLLNFHQTPLPTTCNSSLSGVMCVVSATGTTINNVQPYTQYFIQILAANAIGYSLTTLILVRTDEDGNTLDLFSF